jgi:hypothetical protein
MKTNANVKKYVKSVLAMVWCLSSFGCLLTQTQEDLYEIPDDISSGGTLKWSTPFSLSSIWQQIRSITPGTNGSVYLQNYDTLYGVDPQGNVEWEFDAEGSIYNAPIYDSPTIGPDGTIYVLVTIGDSSSCETSSSSSYNQSHGTLYALNTDGTQKWALESKDYLGWMDSPIVGDNGMIYVSTDDYLAAITPEGTQQWSVTFTQTDRFTEYTTISGSTLYRTGVTSEDFSASNYIEGQIDVLSYIIQQYNTSDGSFISEFTLDALDGEPVVDSNETIYTAAANVLTARSSDGSVVWTFNANEEETFSSLQIAEDGTLYAAFCYSEEVETDSNNVDHFRLYALNPKGKMQWAIPMGVDASAVQIGPEGTLYFFANDNDLYAVDSDGNWKWRFEGEETFTSITVSTDGTIELVSETGTLYAVEDTGATQ